MEFVIIMTDLFNKKFKDYLSTRRDHYRNFAIKAWCDIGRIQSDGIEPDPTILKIAGDSEDRFLKYAALCNEILHREIMTVVSVTAIVITVTSISIAAFIQ